MPIQNQSFMRAGFREADDRCFLVSQGPEVASMTLPALAAVQHLNGVSSMCTSPDADKSVLMISTIGGLPRAGGSGLVLPIENVRRVLGLPTLS